MHVAEQHPHPPLSFLLFPRSMLVVALTVRVPTVISTDTLQGYLLIGESEAPEAGKLGLQTRS